MTSLGNAGLTGRAQVRPVNYDDIEDPEDLDLSIERVALAMPSMCRRTLNMPPSSPFSLCQPDCAGMQRDGGCLCDIVREANAQGVEWRFEIDASGYWVYAGPALSTEG